MQADWILAHATLITMDAASTVFPDGALAVAGDRLLAVGTSAEILREHTSEHVLDCSGRVLLRGLVNAHTHVPMTLLRGLADVVEPRDLTVVVNISSPGPGRDPESRGNINQRGFRSAPLYQCRPDPGETAGGPWHSNSHAVGIPHRL